MQNGYFHDTGKYAPETAVGTGAVEPLVDEYEAATATPSVDETTLDAVGQKSRNKPRPNENSDIQPSGESLADDASDDTSTGEDFETRSGENENISDTDDAEVNKLASEVRPEAPQKTKRQRKAEQTV